MISLDELLNASEVFLTRFPDGCQASWKLLSIKQYEALRGLVSSGLMTEAQARHEAFRMCVFDHGPIFDEWPAGYVDAIGAMILWYSGDCNPVTLKQDLVALRQVFTGRTPYEHMVTVILTAFSHLTFDEVESWSRNKLLQTFVRAEHILRYQYGDEGFSYLDPNGIMFGEREEETPQQGIDFEKEAFQQSQEGFSPWAEYEVDEQEQLAQWRKLTKEQAKALDRRR